MKKSILLLSLLALLVSCVNDEPWENDEHGGKKFSHTYVDLGLPSGLKWGTCNMGAKKPEDYGDYYAWGEMEPYYKEGYAQSIGQNIWESDKSNGYDWPSYRWCKGSDYHPMTKYCIKSMNGMVDSKIVLTSEDDVAHVKWGGNWRMPTFAELDELKAQCTWTWTEQKGVYGFRVVGPNGKSIFLPAAGIRNEYDLIGAGLNGNYWSSSLDMDESDRALDISFVTSYVYWNSSSRCCGQSVRPVYDEGPIHEYVDLGLPSGLKWATCNVGAASPEDFGDYYAWGETEPQGDNSYLWESYQWCNGSYDSMTKYCISSDYGTIDNKVVLGPEDDVAHVKWGGNWRLPTKAEQYELCTECSWTWIAQDGMIGYEVVGPNGKSIFLPAAGFRQEGKCYNIGRDGGYWSSSLNTDYSSNAYYMYFVSNYVDWQNCSRYCGQSVRPVYTK